MADIKWIKITTDIFDDEKILLVESMPDADAVIVIWFKLLCLAGKQNNSGVFTMNDKIAYTDEMLATIFRRPVNTVRMALDVFEQFGMIDRIDGVITIPNWGKHQNFDKIERNNEYHKEYMREYRQKQKLLAECEVNSKVNSKVNVNALDKNREDKNREDKDKNIDYKSIVDLYNRLCPSFSKVKSISNARKKAINARLISYNIDAFEELFKKAEASYFLKGKNDRNWTATFDWLIKDSNMAKVLDGNYDNKSGNGKSKSFVGRAYNYDELEKILLSQ